jgi:hypothetical protein
MSSPTEIQESLQTLNRLLHEIAECLSTASRADRRAAALKLDRMVAVTSTLAATVRASR